MLCLPPCEVAIDPELLLLALSDALIERHGLAVVHLSNSHLVHHRPDLTIVASYLYLCCTLRVSHLGSYFKIVEENYK